MRKLQITGIYLTLLLTLFFIPKPESLLEMETYESKLRKIEKVGEDQRSPYVITTPPRDTFSYVQQTP